jgi:hypothetical protein
MQSQFIYLLLNGPEAGGFISCPDLSAVKHHLGVCLNSARKHVPENATVRGLWRPLGLFTTAFLGSQRRLPAQGHWMHARQHGVWMVAKDLVCVQRGTKTLCLSAKPCVSVLLACTVPACVSAQRWFASSYSPVALYR